MIRIPYRLKYNSLSLSEYLDIFGKYISIFLHRFIIERTVIVLMLYKYIGIQILNLIFNNYKLWSALEK